MDSCIFWRLGFRQSSYSPYHTGPSAHRSVRLDTTADFLPCCCPRSPFGSGLGIRPRNIPPSSSPLRRGYDKAPRGASCYCPRFPFEARLGIGPRNLLPSSSRLNRGYNRAPRGAVPAQHRPRRDQQTRPPTTRFGQQATQRRQDRSISPRQSRIPHLAPQHQHLMPKHQDLGVLLRVGPDQQHKQPNIRSTAR